MCWIKNIFCLIVWESMEDFFSPLEELDVTHSQTLDLFSCCWLKHIRLKVLYLFWRMQILNIVNHLYASNVKHLGKSPGSHLPRVLLVWGMFIACMWWHCTVQCTCFQEGLRLDLRKIVRCGLEAFVCACVFVCEHVYLHTWLNVGMCVCYVLTKI